MARRVDGQRSKVKTAAIAFLPTVSIVFASNVEIVGYFSPDRNHDRMDAKWSTSGAVA